MGFLPRASSYAATVLLVTALAGCGASGAVSTATRSAEPAETPAPAATAVVVAATVSPAPAPRRSVRKPRVPRRVNTLAGALRRARMAKRISKRRYADGRRVDARARAAVGRLSGVRRAELARVISALDGLAREGTLVSSRLALAVLTLRRNVELYTSRPLPAAGARMTFGKDPTVFQYWSGKGAYFHPLATAGKVNALAKVCMEGKRPCRRRALSRAANRLAALASRRSGYAAWEYLVAYGGGRPPWVSGMAQATVAQSLARSASVLKSPRLSKLAVAALGAFDQAPPAGVSVPAGAGRHYVMYSFNPGQRILNGFLQSVIGLHDVAALTGSGRAKRLYRQGEIAARAAVEAYDTGAWSLYSYGGRESTLSYHRLVRTFLGRLCERTSAATYCGASKRFARYTREPPRIRLVRLKGLKTGKPASIGFTLSKVSQVTVKVAGYRGKALERRMTLARGAHSVAWRPTRHGRYRVQVVAVGPTGHKASSSKRVKVTKPPKPKKPKKSKPKRGDVVRDGAGLPTAR